MMWEVDPAAAAIEGEIVAEVAEEEDEAAEEDAAAGPRSAVSAL